MGWGTRMDDKRQALGPSEGQCITCKRPQPGLAGENAASSLEPHPPACTPTCKSASVPASAPLGLAPPPCPRTLSPSPCYHAWLSSWSPSWPLSSSSTSSALAASLPAFAHVICTTSSIASTKYTSSAGTRA